MRLSRLNAGLGVAFLVLYFVARIPTVVDPDLFHRLSTGAEMFSTGAIPLADHFAYTPTRYPVVRHEWAAAGLFYLVATRTGELGFLVLKYALALGAAAGALLIARREGATIATLAVLAPLGLNMAAPGMTTIRAQVLTLVFTVVVLYMIAADRRGERWWPLPYLGLHVVWVNVHGGFVVGPGLLTLHALEQGLHGRSVRHVVLTLVASFLLIAVNPYGVGYYGLFWEALRLDRSLITEWRPLWEARSGLFPWLVSLLVLGYVVRRLGWRETPGWLVALGSAFLALRVQRHVSIYGLVWAAQLPPLVERTRLGRLLERWWNARPAATAAVLLLALSWAITTVAREQPWRVHVPTRLEPNQTVVYPVGVVAYLRSERFSGNLMVPFVLGAFISWKLHPAVKVSIDGRYESAYPPELLVEHEDFYRHRPGWREMLTRYPTDAVLVPKGWPAEHAMRSETSWPLVYEDDAFQLYARPGLALPTVDRRGTPLVATFP